MLLRDTGMTMSDQRYDRRTETNRFTDDDTIEVSDLIEGDRVDPALVAGSIEILGETDLARPDAPPTQLAVATATRGLDDVHTAILVDGESGHMAVASRHDSQSAWTQREADWKIRSVGTRIDVTDAEIDSDPNDEWDEESADDGAEAWANTVLQDRACGYTDYEDEIRLTGRSSMKLYEPWETTTVYASFELVDD